MLYSFLDEYGFWRSSVTQAALEYMPQTVKDKLVASVPPEQSAGHLKAWKWNATSKAWTAEQNLKGHIWYNPERTAERHTATTPDDAPPVSWQYLFPGSNVDSSLLELREKRWKQIKSAREAQEIGGFVWDGSIFDSDQISQSRIQGAAQMAVLANASNSGFTVDWTLADNSVRSLTADEMIAVGMALGQHITSTHAKGRLLRSQIEESQTAEQVEAVSW